MRKLSVLIVLGAFWLLMSGLYKTLILVFGLCSVLLVFYFLDRMNSKDGHRLEINLSIMRACKYALWLFSEIVKSNIAVTKILLSKNIAINQKFIEVPSSQKTELGQVIYANSITLTPGTVTIETKQNNFIVHVLNENETTCEELKKMDRQVSIIES